MKKLIYRKKNHSWFVVHIAKLGRLVSLMRTIGIGAGMREGLYGESGGRNERRTSNLACIKKHSEPFWDQTPPKA